MVRRPPTSPLFPHTTRCRSLRDRERHPPVLERAGGIQPLVFQPHLRVQLGRDPVREDQRRVALVERNDRGGGRHGKVVSIPDRTSTRLNSSHATISYAVFCL